MDDDLVDENLIDDFERGVPCGKPTTARRWTRRKSPQTPAALPGQGRTRPS
ncbi:MAG: hypothetical protein R3A10_21645 [Caldilineaceae bacterium]